MKKSKSKFGIRARTKKDGTKYFDTVVEVNGQRHYLSADSYEDIITERDRLRDQRNRKVRSSVSGRVIAEDMFKAWKRYRKPKQGTIDSYSSKFNCHIQPFFKGEDMRQISIEDMILFFEHLETKENPVSPPMRNRIKSVLSAMFTVAIRNRLFNSSFRFNPLSGIVSAEEGDPKIQWWNQVEIGKFLDANHGQYYLPFLFVGLNLGLRIGELLALDSCQIDASTHLVSVDRMYSKHEKKIVMRQKSGFGKVRYLGIEPAVQQVLYPLLGEGLIFQRPEGGLIDADRIRKVILPEYCKRARIKLITPHGLRHSYSSNYLTNGGKLQDLMEILGHSSPAITMKYYAHFDKDHVRNRMIPILKDGNLITANFGGHDRSTKGHDQRKAK